MKVLMINGSPNAKGCTYTALSEVGKALTECGVDWEIVHVGNRDVRGCIACRKCRTLGKCVFDDIVNECAEKFEQADALILGSPVYYAGVNGTLSNFITRLMFSTTFDKSMKVGAAVVSCRRGGASATFDAINKFFTISQMPVVSSKYWNSVHGNSPEEVLQDLEGLQVMRTLGRNTAFLIKSIALGKETFGLPAQEAPVSTNFIR